MEISNGQRQVMPSYPLNEVLPNIGCPKSSAHLSQELRTKPQAHPQEPLRCPRCDSSNTKFCYYNNYSLSQPRYFCKGCRRYWTKGGTLRNVPVGGGCRKNKRPSSSSSPSPSSPASAKKLINFPALPLPPLSYDPVDLSLTFSNLQNDAFLIGGGNHNPNPGGASFLDILKTGLVGPADPHPAVGGFQGLYYGFGVGSGEGEGGDNGVVLPFNHGAVGVRNSTISAVGGVSGHGSSYWNGGGAGSTSWQSFINGFPHEIHDGGA